MRRWRFNNASPTLYTNYIPRIQFADNNKVLDLHRGSAANGNEIHIWPADGHFMGNKTWRLERLSNDTGEAFTEEFQGIGARLQHDLNAKTEKLARNELELAGCWNDIADKDKEITRLSKVLAKKEQELSGQRLKLTECEDTIRSLRQQLKMKGAVAHPGEPGQTIQLCNRQSHLENKVSQQQAETANLQAKMDRFEYLMSKMINRDQGSSH
ncbi:Ricin-type beta-trefoil lectin domain containing protein [Ceratobasidium theobromae]|uniref:Ricin-type beta-trefoil lectin domain containing protein n=1 Tax=Ceratobasidium theobromae TaxID=1582974 RepID=A0A5N5QGR9_9AGAM|nr:Ricin-type beta-trefoil lectin domain containing protein [Ceratobasidium theobromae]